MFTPKTNWGLFYFAGIAILAATVLMGAGFDDGHANDGLGKDKEVAHNGTASPTYNYRFGKSPFLPSQAKSLDDSFLAPDSFPKASYCANCHADIHQQWRQSAHANSFRAPFYKNNVDVLIHQKGIEFTRHCEGCHNPIALFSGALTTGSKIERTAIDNDGVTCSVCHSIVKVQSTSGTGSYVMGTPAVMVKADGTRIPGEVSYDEIL